MLSRCKERSVGEWQVRKNQERRNEMVYEWKVNGIYKTDANVAGKVLEELNNTVGLTNENLVNASRPENAPLHNEFEWNDSIAAEKYRNVQAGKMINLLAVRIEEKNDELTRAFYTLNAKIGSDGSYENIRKIMVEPEKKNRLLDIALKELKQFRDKYKMLNELAEVFKAIDKVVE